MHSTAVHPRHVPSMTLPKTTFCIIFGFQWWLDVTRRHIHDHSCYRGNRIFKPGSTDVYCNDRLLLTLIWITQIRRRGHVFSSRLAIGCHHNVVYVCIVIYNTHPFKEIIFRISGQLSRTCRGHLMRQPSILVAVFHM